MPNKAASRLVLEPYSEEAVIRASRECLQELGCNPSVVWVFASSDYRPHLADFLELIQLHSHATLLMGGSAWGLIGSGVEAEAATGEAVARLAARLWSGAAVPPLLTSFKPDALAAAQTAAPELPRGLLVDTLWGGWFEKAQELGCVAVIANYALWDAANVAQVHGAGMRCLSYTVNDDWAAQHLLALGTDGIITDRVDLFSPI